MALTRAKIQFIRPIPSPRDLVAALSGAVLLTLMSVTVRAAADDDEKKVRPTPEAATTAKAPVRDLESCGPMREVTTAEGWIDYRLKDLSPVVKKGVHDLDYYHTTPAIEEMRTGSLYRSIKANLDFALRYSPNHHLALQTLIRYDRAGGKTQEFPETQCYFSWAREFAPDDDVVWESGGYYLWTKKNYPLSEYWYRKSLELNPGSAEAHYNIALLYIDMGDYKQALSHAQTAYALGYPLPGLKQKLQKLGEWREPAAEKKSDATP